MAKKNLHVCQASPIISQYIEFINKHFDSSQHEFRLFGEQTKCVINPANNIYVSKGTRLGRMKSYFGLIFYMCCAKKIILHGLSQRVVRILWAMPWLLRKCYWVMWGGDLYVYSLGARNNEWKRNEFFRRPVIKKMGTIVSMVEGNYKLAQSWYHTDAKYIYSFIYLSNLYKEPLEVKREKSFTQIMIGNSADPENNHIEIFEKIKPHLSGDYRIVVPLSYGDVLYAQKVIAIGEKMFGEKMCPMVDFMIYDEYMEVLNNTDIALYNHKRSQGLGNITDLLGFGAKVYIRSDTTTWGFLHNVGLDIFDYLSIDSITGDLMEGFDSRNNCVVVREVFTLSELSRQWVSIFNA